MLGFLRTGAAVLAICALLTSCAPDVAQPGAERLVVNVGGLRGPTGMALAGMKDAARNGLARHDYQVTFDGAPDQIQSKLLNGELDIAAITTNLAAVLYNRTEGEIRLIAVSRMNVLSIMQAPGADINSIADLAGKTLFSAGQGSAQEYILEYLLRENGLDPETDLNIEYKSENAEVAALLLAGECDAALLPQPFVTTVTGQDAQITVALDINTEWDALSGGVELAMSCIVARAAFAGEHPEAIADFLEDYAASITFANENTDAAAALIGEFEIIPEPVAKKAIPLSDIRCITGEEMKAAVNAYLDVLFRQNPRAVGGALPDERFYFP